MKDLVVVDDIAKGRAVSEAWTREQSSEVLSSVGRLIQNGER